ncbi:MAG: metallophosphoesterase [Phycisphaeraceae bacterium]|nr:metallophosphoesterase [Phycisphaeraceae bacterium]
MGSDLKGNRKSLAQAIAQSENPEKGFDWDIMIDVGDLSGNQGYPKDDEGQELIRQYKTMKRHHRSHVYNLAGNHDATGPDDPNTQWWFRKYGDPLGKHTKHSDVDPTKRPFPVQGEWDHYSFQFGNVLVLMMSDRNDGGPPVGRGARGGYPAGAVTDETFNWWVQQVEANPDKIIISAHHHMLKETTVGSGEWEGFESRKLNSKGRFPTKYHGYYADGAPKGASYLYWVGGRPDAQAFEKYLAEHPGAIDLWIGGHTHTHPDDVVNGRSHIERKWGVNFVNTCALAKHHGKREWQTPMSRLFTFTEDSSELLVRCYLHTDKHATQGWYEPAQRTLKIRHPFKK